MRITTEELRQATLLLIAHLEDTGQEVFSIEEDFYWHIPKDKCYDPYKKPEDFTMGQLSDDWAEIKAILAGGRKPVGYSLVWLSAVLRRVGETAR
jgi:hypothetical protein